MNYANKMTRKSYVSFQPHFNLVCMYRSIKIDSTRAQNHRVEARNKQKVVVGLDGITLENKGLRSEACFEESTTSREIQSCRPQLQKASVSNINMQQTFTRA
ncbi:uncharacterized protein CCR75_007521 [Bremia lactucae]|uniref:Uncharacterized protein n=1 Tax=Bremia lactucae TaxID=4779 RepID=A0A976IBJ7_BRELC|nr:hypothetical protein CCR75_007521 [Bremia lactucae]